MASQGSPPPNHPGQAPNSTAAAYAALGPKIGQSAVLDKLKAMAEITKFMGPDGIPANTYSDQLLNGLEGYVSSELGGLPLATVENDDVVVLAGSLLQLHMPNHGGTKTLLKQHMTFATKLPRNSIQRPTPTHTPAPSPAQGQVAGNHNVHSHEDRQKEANSWREIFPGCATAWPIRQLYPMIRYMKVAVPKLPVDTTDMAGCVTFSYKQAETIRAIILGSNPVQAFDAWQKECVKEFRALRGAERPPLIYADSVTLYLQLLRQLATTRQTNSTYQLSTVDHELIHRTAELMLFTSQDHAKSTDHVLGLLHRLAVAHRAPEVFTPALEAEWLNATAALPADDVLIPCRPSAPLK